MKKIMVLLVLAAVCVCGTAWAQSGISDKQVSATAAILGSKIAYPTFATVTDGSVPSAVTYQKATIKTLAVGDIIRKTGTALYYVCTSTTGPEWKLISISSVGEPIVPYAGEPNAAQYLTASGKALAVGSLVLDTTAKVLKQCTNTTGPVYKPVIYSASGTGLNLKSNENNTGTGIAFVLDNDNALDDADIMLQLQEATAAFLNIYSNGNITNLKDGTWTITSSKTNVGDDKGIILNNSVALTAPDALVSIQNAGTPVLEFAPNGTTWGMVTTNSLSFVNQFTGTGAAGEIGLMIRNDGVVALAADDILVNYVNEAATVSNLYADGRLALSLGAVTTPSLTFLGDLNTGIYSPGAEQVSVAVTGTSVLNFTAATATIPTGVDLAIAAGGDLTIADAPVAGTDAVNKTYVDNALLFGTQLTAAGGVSVTLNAIAVTPLYTCPAGRKCVIEKVVIRSASVNVNQLADATYNIGWDLVASGVVASVALVNPTVTTTSWHPVVVGVGSVAEQTMGLAAEVLNFNVTAACTDPTTIRVDVFGYSY